jgi:hypothetical protein
VVKQESYERLSILTKHPRTRRTFLHPSFSLPAISHPSYCLQLAPGRKMYETMELSTAPSEKNTESRVNRYCLEWGRFSRNKVPSVGIEPLWSQQSCLMVLLVEDSPHGTAQEEHPDA